MKYSKSQAQKLAKQIRDRFGLKIARAVEGTPVPQKYVAGLISVEAGKDRQGQIKEDATRFEPHVFAKLKQVRNGSLLQYNKIRTAPLKDASDVALEALAKSYGLTQVMGWWSIHLDCTVAELRDPETHLNHAVRLMMLNSNGDFERGEYEGEFRQWNSGSEKGKTHDPDYLFNANSVMEAYEAVGDVEAEPSIAETPAAAPDPPALDSKPSGDKPTPEVETVQSNPPVVEVKTPAGSVGSKIAAATAAIGPALGAAGIKIGGIELSAGGVYALAAIVIIGMIVGAVLWDRDRGRQLERQKLSVQNLASHDKANVIAAGSKA